MKVVAVPGAFDVKSADYQFLMDEIHRHGIGTLSIDIGVLADPPFTPDISSAQVAQAGGGSLDKLRASRDKTAAMRTMTEGLRAVVSRLYLEGRIHGICGMGGTGGTAVLSAACRELPLGVPKLLISTVAGTDVSPYVGARDITMMPSIVDIAGINRISRRIYSNAAAAIAGMVAAGDTRVESDRPLVAASMFGNTTACVDRARGILEERGFEVLTFHATGAGGRMMQSLASDRLLSGLLDLTTTELADEVCGGVFTAGRERVRLGSHDAIPVVLAPGCVDMCNFGALQTVPEKYRSRRLYEWNAQVTLMRTNEAENRSIGRLLAETANQCLGPVVALLPLGGVSMLDAEGGPFRDEEADGVCYQTFKECVRPGVRIVEVDANINDPVFADKAANLLLEMVAGGVHGMGAASALMESR
jgi:uncharacterized protein (UPF0261 family)